MLELNTEEGFMAYTAPEDAQRPRHRTEGCIRHKSRLSRYLTNLFYF